MQTQSYTILRSFTVTANINQGWRKKLKLNNRNRGDVFLVGAGPGDPKLLTLRAEELISSADVIAFDDLVNPAILALAKPSAELLSVGHRSTSVNGLQHRHPDQPIHPSVIERALEGKSVVRLKAGDPFIFGRGGEEAVALTENGISFEVVPGITAALGAASALRIPLTHRGMATKVSIATGSVACNDPIHSELGVGRSETVVMYMVRRRLSLCLSGLIEQGYSPDTPAAYVASATLRTQHIVMGKISNLVEKTENLPNGFPALVIVGDVLNLADRIERPKVRELSGTRILLARARSGESTIAKELTALGSDVIEVPQISTHAVEWNEGVGMFSLWLKECEGIIFACKPGVEHFLSGLTSTGEDVRKLGNLPIFAIGKQAKQALANVGVLADHSTEFNCKVALEQLRSFISQKRLILIGPKGGRPRLLDDLTMLGAHVREFPVFALAKRFPRVVSPPPQLIIIPSSSSAKNLCSGEVGTCLKAVPAVTMGPISSDVSKKLGFKKIIQAETDSFESLIESVKHFFGEQMDE